MLKRIACELLIFTMTMLICNYAFSQDTPEGTAWVSSHGYSNCVQLFNNTTKVILEPNCGGRVLEYSLNGKNALYIDPEQDGWTYTAGGKIIDPTGGRFDIGPEQIIPRHPNLWVGKWRAEIIAPREARLTSVKDAATGVQLIREFKLDKESSLLRCTQTIKNVSTETKQYSHWSRTFASPFTVCLIPLNPKSRFPLGYILYGPGPVMNYRPKEHPNIKIRDGFLEISGTPPQPKFGIDSYAGWLGYITRDNLLFVKRFPVYPKRVYGEMAGFTISIWYFKEKMCELEPIGPMETLKPGESASFTEEWWLFPYDYPQEGQEIALDEFRTFVEAKTR